MLRSSAVEAGFFVDDMLDPDGSISDSGMYVPGQGPFDPAKPCANTRPPVEARFNGILAYKNREHGIWAKWNHRFSDCKLLDNRFGFMCHGYSLLEDSLLVGETDNMYLLLLMY
jgi:hypothetical protein